jgi:hypothetical protein
VCDRASEGVKGVKGDGHDKTAMRMTRVRGDGHHKTSHIREIYRPSPPLPSPPLASPPLPSPSASPLPSSALPPVVGNLIHLRHLDGRFNRLIHLPSEVSCLHRLTHLDLGDNHLTRLPLSLDQRLRSVTLTLRWTGMGCRRSIVGARRYG